jgi:hypothetical protein
MKIHGNSVSHLVPNDPKKPGKCNRIVDKRAILEVENESAESAS